MLILKVFVNDRQIDEIHVHNMDGDPISHYEIVEPFGIDTIIMHKRSRGWIPLAHSVLEVLMEQERLENEEAMVDPEFLSFTRQERT